MNGSRLTTVIVAAALALGALAGCGGDDGDEAEAPETTTVSGPLSKAEYISEGDRICAEGTARIAQRALELYGSSQPSLDEIDGFARDVVAPTLEEQVEQLRALPPPKGDAKTVDAIYNAVEEGVEALNEDPQLLTEPGTGGAFDRANRLARKYGFKQCGSS